MIRKYCFANEILDFVNTTVNTVTHSGLPLNIFAKVTTVPAYNIINIDVTRFMRVFMPTIIINIYNSI